MIDLPDYPSPNGATPGLIDFGGLLEPMLGGEVQRIDRLGNRFKINVTLPPMPSRDVGRIWVSRLIRGKAEGVRLPYPLLSFDPGVPGSPVVDGADQTGRTLAVSGFTAAYAVKEGQPFSIEDENGRHYLHFADGQTIADGNGDADVPLSPMLRHPFEDGATCHFAKPMIEGFIRGEDWRWEMMLDHNLGLTFEIEEYK